MTELYTEKQQKNGTTKWKREQATEEEYRSIQGECQESQSSATAETGNGHEQEELLPLH